ncbi:hypothetical protein XOCgx_0658 [Xanthomonas oryzae pv. oryzicola]|nr:hypothetical protein XOCgx_0658 [Xanthomonas oryzae pv. oryzicola]
MARHKQPDELARLKGADKQNPQRYKRGHAQVQGAVGASTGPPAGCLPAEFRANRADFKARRIRI